MLDLDKWIEQVKSTQYLAEDELKALCDYVGLAFPALEPLRGPQGAC